MLSFIFGRQTEAEKGTVLVCSPWAREEQFCLKTGFGLTSLYLHVFVVAVFFPRGFPLTELSKHFDHDCRIILFFRDHEPDKGEEGFCLQRGGIRSTPSSLPLSFIS